jgi:hypothetical protein
VVAVFELDGKQNVAEDESVRLPASFVVDNDAVLVLSLVAVDGSD